MGCAQLDMILTLFFNGVTPLRSDLWRHSWNWLGDFILF
jgi:hypothetical protein